jgi:quercetin dioxygenase-like cupin family protein
MEHKYAIVDHLTSLIPEISEGSIISRTFYEDEHAKFILFGFAAGQELSEHTASVPAALYFLQGQAELTLGTDAHHADPGTFVQMQARLPHTILAKTPVWMLLIMNKAAA